MHQFNSTVGGKNFFSLGFVQLLVIERFFPRVPNWLSNRDWVLISLEVTITLENFLSDWLRVNCEDLYNAIGQLLMVIPSSILMPTSVAVLQVFQ